MNDSSHEAFPAVWLTDATTLPVGSAPAWLTGDEAARFDRLTGPSQREFVGSRWLIRHALNAATGDSMANCRPVVGRPVQSEVPAGWHLSVSHSHGLTGCAVSPHAGIGLDLEPLKRRSHWQRVVKRWFAPAEQDWLLDANDAEQFLTVWTLKEAWLKATGRGIANNLRSLQVTEAMVLTGDGATGWASVGRFNDFLISVVSLQSTSQPQARLLSPTDDALCKPGQTLAQVDWFIHRPIQSDASSVHPNTPQTTDDS